MNGDRTRTRRRLTGIVAAVALLTGACSASDGSVDTVAEERAAERADAGDAREAEGGSADETTAGSGEAGGIGDATAIAVGAPADRKVVFDAHLSLEADDPAATVDDIRTAVERAGGFVARADLHRTGDRDLLTGEMTLRVPAEKLATTLTELKSLAARVTDEGIDSDDVTGQYADVEAQLRNLRALETELLALLADIRERSDDAAQVLAVFERIREVRSEIERLQGRKDVLDDLVALSTITVSIQPTPSAAPIASDEWRPGEVVRDSLRATVTALQGLAELSIRLVVTVLPLLLLLVGLPAAIALGVRRAWRRRDAQRVDPSPTS